MNWGVATQRPKPQPKRAPVVSGRCRPVSRTESLYSCRHSLPARTPTTRNQPTDSVHCQSGRSTWLSAGLGPVNNPSPSTEGTLRGQWANVRDVCLERRPGWGAAAAAQSAGTTRKRGMALGVCPGFCPIHPQLHRACGSNDHPLAMHSSGWAGCASTAFPGRNG